MTEKPAPPSREAEIAARLEKSLEAWPTREDASYLLAQLQQARQERDDWKRRAEDAEGRISNATA